MGKSSKSLSVQASKYFLGRATALVIHFIVPIVLVRIFVKSDFGKFAQFLLIYELLFRISQFGFKQSVFYFLPLEKGNKSYYITNTYIILFIGGILNIIFLTLFKNDIASLMNAEEIAQLLPLCGLHILFRLVSSPFEPALISEKKAEIASMVVFGSQVVRGLFIIVFVIIYKTVFSAVLGLIFYSGIRFLVYTIFIFRNIGIKFDKHSFYLFKKQFRYSMPIGFSGIISNIYKRIDKFILSIFFTPEIFAIYRIGNFKIPFVQLLFQSVGEVTLPRAVEMLKEKNISNFLILWKRLLTVFSFVGIGAFFLFQILAYDIITLMFTAEYAASVPIFRIILFVILGEMMQYGIVLRSTGQTKAIFKSNLLAFIISIPATYVLVMEFGPIGAAIAALLGFFVNVISQLTYSMKELKKKATEFFPISTMVKLALISAILAIVLFILQDFIPYKILRIVLSASVFSITYLMICWKTGIYNIFDEKLLKRLVQRFTKKNYRSINNARYHKRKQRVPNSKHIRIP